MPAQPAKSGFLLKTGVILAVLVAAAVAVFYGTRSTAVVKAVWRGTAADLVTGSLVVHANNDLQDIRSEMSGRVEWVDGRSASEPFKKGEPIVKLNTEDLRREISQAESDYKAAVELKRIEREYDARRSLAEEALANTKRLRDRGDASEEDVKRAQRSLEEVLTKLNVEKFNDEQAKTAYDNKQAERRRALEKMNIVAPMDGTVQSVLVAPGALINGGSTVAKFFANDRVVVAKVGEEEIGRVKIGQPAKVRLLNLPGESFDAKVTEILPFADQDTQRYTVHLKVDADVNKLVPFSTGEVTITVGEHANQPLIDRIALFNDRYVWVVKNGRVEKREVQIGFKGLNAVEVTANLQPGELVIVHDVDLFRNGQRVRVELK